MEVDAYIYDIFPFSPVMYKSPPAYGSIRRVSAPPERCCAVPGFETSSITYRGVRAVRVKQVGNLNWRVGDIERWGERWRWEVRKRMSGSRGHPCGWVRWDRTEGNSCI